MDIHELIRYRKSVRAWDDRPVDRSIVERIMESARFAPSAKNGQEWRVIAVTDQSVREKLGRDIAKQPFVAEAPVVLAICGDASVGDMRCGQPRMPMDVGILIDHITLVAANEGLGSCWIGSFDGPGAAKLLGVPEPWEVAQLLPIGYPADPSQITKPRKPLNEILAWEQW